MEMERDKPSRRNDVYNNPFICCVYLGIDLSTSGLSYFFSVKEETSFMGTSYTFPNIWIKYFLTCNLNWLFYWIEKQVAPICTFDWNLKD